MTGKVMPEAWKKVKLGDVASVETGGTPARAVPAYWGGDIPWMASGEVNMRKVFATKETITADGLANSNAKVFEPGTLMLAMNGQGRTRGLIARLGIAATCNQSLAAILAGQDACQDFIFHVLDTRYEEIRNLTGDGRSGLNLGLIRGINLLLPPAPEQRAIATILDSIDEAIEQTGAVIEATEVTRKGFLQELLTHGIPGWHQEWKDVRGIGTVPASWDVVRLGDVAEVTSGFALGPERAPKSNYKPYLTVANVQANQIAVTDARYMEVTDSEYAARHLVEGDLVMVEGHAQISELGRAALVPSEFEGFTFQNHLFRIRSDRSRCFNAFLCAYVNGPGGRACFKAFGGTTSGLNTVSATNVKRLRMPLPSLQEQEAIVDLLSVHDQRQNQQRDNLSELQNLKKACAMALMSGQVRVPAEIEASRD